MPVSVLQPTDQPNYLENLMKTRSIVRNFAASLAFAALLSFGLTATRPVLADCHPSTGAPCKRADSTANPKDVSHPVSLEIIAVSPLIRLILLGW